MTFEARLTRFYTLEPVPLVGNVAWPFLFRVRQFDLKFVDRVVYRELDLTPLSRKKESAVRIGTKEQSICDNLFAWLEAISVWGIVLFDKFNQLVKRVHS